MAAAGPAMYWPKSITLSPDSGPPVSLTPHPQPPSMTCRCVPLFREAVKHIPRDALDKGITIDQAGDALIDMIVRTANGRMTAAEALGHKEFVMTKLYRSA